LTAFANQIQLKIDTIEESDDKLSNMPTIVEIQEMIKEKITSEISKLRTNIAKDIEKLKITKNSIDIDLEFLNEDKITTITDDQGIKTWANNTGSMVQILSKTAITEGVQTLRLQSINDPGG